MNATRLALLSLPLALAACQRTAAPADANAGAPAPPGANRLMTRSGGLKERADAGGRIRCKEAVASIPCEP